MKRAKFLITTAALIAAPAALAQTAPQTATPAQTTPAPQTGTATQTGTMPQTAPTAPATPAPQATTPATPAPATNVTDAEVAQFASIALQVNEIRNDTTLAEADKNAKMAAAVKASGMPLARFNAIGQAMQTDPALNTRIQTAATAVQQSAAPAPAAQ